MNRETKHPGQLRTLLVAQIRQDLRHPRTGKVSASRAVLTAVSYAFSGLVLAVSMGSPDLNTAIFVTSSFAIVLAAFGMIGSYDELMGRPRDHAWALTLPVAERLHYIARLLHLGSYGGLLALSFGLPVGAVVALKMGLGAGALALAATTLATVWTAMGSVLALWVLTLYLPTRLLQPALNLTRGALVGMLVLGYQWVGSQGALPIEVSWWPGTWLADAHAGRPTVGLTLFLASSAFFLLTFAFHFPDRFFALLDRLAESERLATYRRRPAALAADWMQRILVGDPVRKAAYGFASSAISSDRLVRGRVWPAALLPIGFALFGWWTGGLGDLFELGAYNVLNDPALHMHVSVLVVLLFCAQSLVQATQLSDDSEAAWVFDSLPYKSTRTLQMGAQQALTHRVLFPLAVCLGVVAALGMPPLHAALQASFWFAATVLTTRVQVLFYGRAPFARRSDRFGMAERFVPLILSMPLGLIFLMLQGFTFSSPVGAALGIAGLLLVSGALARIVDGGAPSPAVSASIREVKVKRGEALGSA